MARYVVAIDQGTTGYDRARPRRDSCALRGRGYREFAQHFPQPGWVEHDPEEIWQSVLGALADALHGSGIDRRRRARSPPSASPTSARRRCVWERATGKPLHHAIVWQDRRTADICAQLKAAGLEARVREPTGLVLDPYFSGTKLQWLLDNVAGAARARRDGRGLLRHHRQLSRRGG